MDTIKNRKLKLFTMVLAISTLTVVVLVCMVSNHELIPLQMSSLYTVSYPVYVDVTEKTTTVQTGVNIPCDEPFMSKYRTKCHDIHLASDMDILAKEKQEFLPQFKNPCWYSKKGDLLCLPYMYLVGQAKCGTTDLFKRITLHPHFVAPTIKESNWLSSTRFRLNTSLMHYARKYFSPLSHRLQGNRTPGVSPFLITGDASINTMEGAHFWETLGKNIGEAEPIENNPQYIHNMFNGTKILINLRNPVNRLWSEYLAFSKDKEKTPEMFHGLVVQEINVYKQCFTTKSVRACVYDRPRAMCATMSNSEREDENCRRIPINIVMLRRGLYHVHIEDYMKVFPPEQILIQRLEDISDDGRGSLKNTFKFLGLRPLTDEEMTHIMSVTLRNTRKKSDRLTGNMLPATRQLLYNFYKPFNKKLALLLKDSKYNYGPS